MTPRAHLSALRDAGHLSDLDVHLADLMARLAGDDDPALLYAAALASHRTGEGHVCADLAAVAGGPLVAGAPDAPGTPALAAWTDALRRTAVVGGPDDDAPLVLDVAGRLYLRRYWAYERELARDLIARAAAPVGARSTMRACVPRSPRSCRPMSRRRRPTGSASPPSPRSCVACASSPAARAPARPAPWCDCSDCSPPSPRAPGRRWRWRRRPARRRPAWRRRSGAGLGLLPAPLRHAIPEHASTVHRLVGVQRDSPRVTLRQCAPAVCRRGGGGRGLDGGPRAHGEAAPRAPAGGAAGAARRQGPAGVGRGGRGARATCAATSPASRRPSPRGSPASSAKSVPAGRAAATRPLRDSVVLLRHSHRFTATSGIARLAAAVNRGDGDGAVSVLLSEPGADVGWMTARGRRAIRDALAAAAVEEFAPYLACIRAGAPAGAGARGVRGLSRPLRASRRARPASRW